MLHTNKLIILFAVIAICSGCVNHIKPYKPRERDYRPSMEVVPVEENRSEGSLWSDRSQSNRFFADPLAGQVNDILVVRIEEMSKADQAATTQLDRTSGIEAQVDALLGALKTFEQAHPNFDRTKMISSKFKSDFEGGGKTGRSGNVIATVPSIIKRELSDGNYFIEGHRVVLVNNEEAHFYVSGIIRPYDIEKDNSISSSKIAEAQIEFTGRGVVSEKNMPGWGSRVLDYVWPF